MFKKSTLAVLLIATTLSACATGPMNGQSKDAMQMIMTWKNPDYGPMTDEEYKHVVKHAQFCKKVADQQLSSTAESVVTMGAAYGVAGALGVAGGAKAGGIGTIAQMGPYGALAGAANGAVAGALVHSNAKVNAVGSCVYTDLSDSKSRIPGVHATASYVRTNNHSNKVPTWAVPASSVAHNDAQQSGDSDTDNNMPLPPPPPAQ